MISFLLPQLIAQSIRNPALPDDLASQSGAEFFGNLIPTLLSLGLVIGAIVFLIYFIIGGISWISSGGDKMKMEQARSKITTAIIGLVILLSFIAILNLVECFFGIGLRQFEVGPFQINFSSIPACSGSGPGGPIPCTGPNPCGPLQCVDCNPNTGTWVCYDPPCTN